MKLINHHHLGSEETRGTQCRWSNKIADKNVTSIICDYGDVYIRLKEIVTVT